MNLAMLCVYSLLQFTIALVFYWLGRNVGHEAEAAQTLTKTIKRLKTPSNPAGPIDYDSEGQTDEEEAIEAAQLKAARKAGFTL